MCATSWRSTAASSPARATLRRHHRPAGTADGRDAVTDALAVPGAARGAAVDDGRLLLRDDRLRSWISRSWRATWTCCCRAAWVTGSGSGATRPLSLDGALAQMARLGRWIGSRTSCRRRPGRRDLPDVDLDEVRRLLGDEAAQDLGALRPICAGCVEAAGYLDPRRRPPGAHATRQSQARAGRAGDAVRADCSATPSAAIAVAPARAGRRARGDDRAPASSATRSTWTCDGRRRTPLMRDRRTPRRRGGSGLRAELPPCACRPRTSWCTRPSS